MSEVFTNDDVGGQKESDLVRLLGSGLQKNVCVHDALAKIAQIAYVNMQYAETSSGLLDILAVYEDGIAFRVNETEWTSEFKYRLVSRLKSSEPPRHGYGIYHETAKVYYWLQLKSETKREGLGKDDNKQRTVLDAQDA